MYLFSFSTNTKSITPLTTTTTKKKQFDSNRKDTSSNSSKQQLDRSKKEKECNYCKKHGYSYKGHSWIQCKKIKKDKKKKEEAEKKKENTYVTIKSDTTALTLVSNLS